MTRRPLLMALSLLGAGCAYDNIPPRAGLEVGPRYARAPRWSDYLDDEGEQPCASPDARAARCRHAGVLRALELPRGEAGCDGVEARDELGWLEWTCEQDGAQARVVAERLRPDISLADLIDAEASPPRWRANALIVTRDDEPWLETSRHAFWSDPVRVVAARDERAVLDEPGAIYVLGAQAPASIAIEADSVALLGAPDSALAPGESDAHAGVTASDRAFLWIERLRIDGYPVGAQLDLAFSALRDLRIEHASERALELEGSHVTVRELAIADSEAGLVASTLRDSELRVLTVANVRNGGVILEADALSEPSENVTLYDVVVGNMLASSGMLLAGHNHRAVRVLVAHNAAEALVIDGDSAVVQHLTAVSNAYSAYQARPGSAGNQLVSALIVNNKYGALLEAGSERNRVHDLLSIRNGGDVRVYGHHNVFTGALMITEETSCRPFEDFEPPVEPGLALEAGCVASGESTAVVSFGERVERLFVGRLEDGAIELGTAHDPTEGTFGEIDWLSLSVRQRMFGRGEPHMFPSGELHGPCTAGTVCAVWDFRLLDASRVKDRFSDLSQLLDADHVRTHVWRADSSAECAHIAGAAWRDDRCVSRFLAYADEPFDDGSGNDNALCEPGERCVVSRNLGAYLGEGSLEPIELDDSTGALELPGFGPVTLLRYERNVP